VLEVLVDDLTVAVPELLGLHLKILMAGDPISLSAGSPDALPAASLHVPLDKLSTADAGSAITFYAGRPGAFVDLAADIRHAYGLDGDVIVDGHLDEPLPIAADPTTMTGITGLSEFSVINQAIGVLIAQGQPTETARGELARRAEQAGTTLRVAAQQLIDEHQSAAG